MNKWPLLVLILTQHCTQDPTLSPNSPIYQQQEDSVLAQVGGKVLGNKRSVVPYSSGSIVLVSEMSYPLTLGRTYYDSSRVSQEKLASEEASRLLKSHSLSSSFQPLLMKLWDRTHPINTTHRSIPYPVLAAEIHGPKPDLLSPPFLIDNQDRLTYNRTSRVCFNSAFSRGVFQVVYSDPGGGTVYLYFIEQENNQWQIVAREYVDGWKY